eukprot:GHVU01096654.1.p1 GENE.GHVU01096654.1~~GHVU01096654.1.p1  ORF type:complete len:360 (-),score=23.71 GHVU01096654.1:54-1133(-)
MRGKSGKPQGDCVAKQQLPLRVRRLPSSEEIVMLIKRYEMLVDSRRYRYAEKEKHLNETVQRTLAVLREGLVVPLVLTRSYRAMPLVYFEHTTSNDFLLEQDWCGCIRLLGRAKEREERGKETKSRKNGVRQTRVERCNSADGDPGAAEEWLRDDELLRHAEKQKGLKHDGKAKSGIYFRVIGLWCLGDGCLESSESTGLRFVQLSRPGMESCMRRGVKLTAPGGLLSDIPLIVKPEAALLSDVKCIVVTRARRGDLTDLISSDAPDILDCRTRLAADDVAFYDLLENICTCAAVLQEADIPHPVPPGGSRDRFGGSVTYSFLSCLSLPGRVPICVGPHTSHVTVSCTPLHACTPVCIH